MNEDGITNASEWRTAALRGIYEKGDKRMSDYYTIGHSNLQLEDFLDNLLKHDIHTVVDIRSWPQSRFCPWFNRKSLQESLRNVDIEYIFLGEELGARRTEPEAYDENGAALYSNISNLPSYKSGIFQLHTIMNSDKVVILCSEGDPITCHRFVLVAKHLEQFGHVPSNILRDGTLESYEESTNRLVEKMKVSTPREAILKQAHKICYRKKN